MTYQEKVKIATIGNVDAGKSTLIGVLTSGELDNGAGKARQKVIKNPHELEKGQSSTVNYHYLFRDGEAVTLVDLCGHLKFYKTTLYGIGVSRPDAALIVVAANAGMQKMTKQHVESVLSLKLPIIIVITKIDFAPKHKLDEHLESMITQFEKIKMHIKIDPGQECIDQINHYNGKQEFIPTFLVSNTVGTGIDSLKDFMFSLKSQIFTEHKPPSPIDTDVFFVDSRWQKTGIGTIYSGYFRGETLKKGDKLFLGPTAGGDFIPVRIRNIHNAFRQDVEELSDGVSGSVAVAIPDRYKMFFRKGIVICRDVEKIKQYVCSKFACKVTISSHSTTIHVGFTPVVHCCGVARSAHFTKVQKEGDNSEIIRCGDKGTAEMLFVGRSKHIIIPGSRFVFREGQNRGYGIITSVVA
jgi:elongation factor 1-alpha